MAEVVQGTTLLTRAQRRRIEQLADAVDRVTQADARFFERFPNRTYRVRHSSAAEVEQNRMMGNAPTIPGRRWFTCVKQIAPGTRCRLFVQNTPAHDVDMADTEAGKIYEFLSRLNGKRVSEIEEQLRTLHEWGAPK